MQRRESLLARLLDVVNTALGMLVSMVLLQCELVTQFCGLKAPLVEDRMDQEIWSGSPERACWRKSSLQPWVQWDQPVVSSKIDKEKKKKK